MSASEPSPLTSNLQESIEHLIAETVRRSQMDHEQETKQLKSALEAALSEVEAGQAAMNRAADLLRNALNAPATEPDDPETTKAVDEIIEESPAPIEEVVADESTEVAQVAEEAADEPEIGPHGLDVIAHDVTFGIASSLQAWLRERPEVSTARTREFVNGELRLEVQMTSGLDMAVFNEWIAEHKGRIKTNTSSVLELSFGS